jgi:hypothetical protein
MALSFSSIILRFQAGTPIHRASFASFSLRSSSMRAWHDNESVRACVRACDEEGACQAQCSIRWETGQTRVRCAV